MTQQFNDERLSDARNLMWSSIARLGVGHMTMAEFETSTADASLPPMSTAYAALAEYEHTLKDALVEENRRLGAQIEQMSQSGAWLARTAAEALDSNPLRVAAAMEEHGLDLAHTPMVHTTAVDYAEVARMRGENRRLTAILREIEWSGGDDATDAHCPSCGAFWPDSPPQHRYHEAKYGRGHHDDCALANAIGEPERESHP